MADGSVQFTRKTRRVAIASTKEDDSASKRLPHPSPASEGWGGGLEAGG